MSEYHDPLIAASAKAVRMKLIYIAGPFRAKTPWLIEQNIRKAEELALKVWEIGGAALCPHAASRFYQHSCPDPVFLEGTLEMMRRCDAVIVTNGWSQSEGTKLEIQEAGTLGIPVFYDLDSLRTWLGLAVNPTIDRR